MVYAIYGDVFAIGCGAMLVLALAASWMLRTSPQIGRVQPAVELPRF